MTPETSVGRPATAEDRDLIAGWNATAVDYPVDVTLHGLISAAALRHPDRVAVRCGAVELSYRALEAEAGRLANLLRERGVGPESLVGVFMERSVELVVSLLAILKAGGAYVPLDPEYPAARVAGMLEDASVALVLTQAHLAEALPAHDTTVLRVDADRAAWENQPAEAPDPGVRPDNAAYVIFTSGSTGRPKGVLNTHRGICNRLLWMQDALQLGADDVVLQKTPFSFDVSVWEFFWPLQAGARLVLARPGGHRDARYLQDLISSEAVTTLHFVPSMLSAFLAMPVESCTTLRRVICSGEALPAAVANETLARLPWAALYNLYGPTEAAVDVTWWRCEQSMDATVPIGRPVANTRIHILDGAGREVAIGEPGELHIGGVQVARGYVGRPELTAERFVPDPFEPGGAAKLYRTGDLARWRADGVVEFLGRIDHQVKIRGFRIEPGEIEARLLAHPSVRECAVLARERAGDLQLVAWVAADAADYPGAAALRRFAAESLPDYMVPAHVVRLDAMPLLPNGKLDRRSLPDPWVAPAPAESAGSGDLEGIIAGAWCTVLGLPHVGLRDNFFDLGGHSLLLLRVNALLREALQRDVELVDQYAHPTVESLARHLRGSDLPEPVGAGGAAARREREPIAIVAMNGRLPGAATPEEFWRNLCAGQESIAFFSRDELLASGVPADQLADAAYVPARGVVDGADLFDASFFGYTPREADLLDPQQRLFLECAWEALERAGHDPARYDGRIGVYAGASNNYYRRDSGRSTPAEFSGMLATAPDFIATRTSYKLHLRGPSMTVSTACSTSLVAVHQACQALLNGECDMALAGGASVLLPLRAGYTYVEGSIQSKDGHCRAFDAEASGTVGGDGVGVVLLKRLSDALRDGNHVHAVILGSAVNNDGADKVGYTAPSVSGQSEVIAAAHAAAGVDAGSIDYVEAHGTGTHMGDPIEIAALSRVFGADRPEPCLIGSAKTNIGHLDVAAGVAGLVKSALCVEHGLLPPSLHYRTPNPGIDFVNGPFRVNTALRQWPSGGQPRRAGVSSFGIGGTNAHAVVEQPPAAPASEPGRPLELLVLSAKTPSALERAAERLARHLDARPDQNLADAAYTLAVGRGEFDHRRIVVAADAREAAAVLAAGDPARSWAGRAKDGASGVVFMFPGQGAQHVQMARDLYDSEPLVRDIVDRGAAVLRPLLGIDIRQVLYPADDAANTAAARLRQTIVAQPTLFVVEYALARLLESWGLAAGAWIGHSVGEYVAATLAGVFDFEDALKLIAERGRLMQEQEPGSMLAVRLAEADVLDRLPEGLCIAAANAPLLTVVSGPAALVAAFQQQLEADGAACTPLHVSHAFHSHMMDAAVAPFESAVARVHMRRPERRWMSTLTGAWVTDEEAVSPAYWARQLREPVRFGAGIAALADGGWKTFIEVGPGTTLATFTHAAQRDGVTAVSCLAHPRHAGSALGTILLAVGRAWATGVSIVWNRFFAGQQRRRVILPTYPFERARHWVDAPMSQVPAKEPMLPAQVPAAAAAASVFDAERERRAAIAAHATAIVAELSGIDATALDPACDFLEMGLDSLFLTQTAVRLQKEFGTPVRFRQLFDELGSVEKLADHLAAVLPPTAFLPEPPAPPAANVVAAAMPAVAGAGDSFVSDVIAQQLEIMRQQLDVLRARGADAPQLPAAAAVKAAPVVPPSQGVPTADTAAAPRKPFGAGTRIELAGAEITPAQQAWLDRFAADYTARTRRSRDFTARHRPVLADPRAVSGFTPLLKKVVYPIVVERSAGASMWDIDGNQYIDVTSAFGANILGFSPPEVVDAIARCMEQGFAIGPQHPLVGDVAELMRELTGHERVTFCNTGSEALLCAVRAARTVTGRDRIVVFRNSYHGIFDEVVVRGAGQRSVPGAAGIPMSAVEQVTVLEYGDDAALDAIRAQADSIAAVLVEPVQSRQLNVQPRAFLQELRALTRERGIALVMDEMITGFRVAPGGAQEYFGVRADIATYGKIVGGGLPIGAVAGDATYLDAIDGGQWSFDDDSHPEAGVTYFAGTFVRHPLALAAARATLSALIEAGPALQQRLNALAADCVARMSAACRQAGVDIRFSCFSSAFQFELPQNAPLATLIYPLLRSEGIHIFEGRTWFLTAAHTQEHIDAIVNAWQRVVTVMAREALLPSSTVQPAASTLFDVPPYPDARLGRDPHGNPGWYRPDPERPGRYVLVSNSLSGNGAQ